jgi:hypothetical protein
MILSFLLLSSIQNNVNIKNIKVCPSAMDKSLRTVYVECDHSLEEEVKEKLENEATQLGLPGTLRVYTQPEPDTKIEKDEGMIMTLYNTLNLQYSCMMPLIILYRCYFKTCSGNRGSAQA